MQESLPLAITVDEDNKRNSFSATKKKKSEDERVLERETEAKPMFIGRSRSQATTSRVTSTIDGASSTATVASPLCGKRLPNGDLYIGSFSENVPHGSGKYLWVDGCMYEGEWRKNLQDGHGRYVWKNGNEYVGDWRNGVINRRGVLIWANGNQFDGQWRNGVIKVVIKQVSHFN